MVLSFIRNEYLGLLWKLLKLCLILCYTSNEVGLSKDKLMIEKLAIQCYIL